MTSSTNAGISSGSIILIPLASPTMMFFAASINFLSPPPDMKPEIPFTIVSARLAKSKDAIPSAIVFIRSSPIDAAVDKRDGITATNAPITDIAPAISGGTRPFIKSGSTFTSPFIKVTAPLMREGNI